MYMRVTPLRFFLSWEPEAERFTNEQIIPALRTAPGFRRYYVGVDRASGHGYSLTLWETREQAEGLRAVLGSQLIQGIQALGIRLGDPQILEVTAEA